MNPPDTLSPRQITDLLSREYGRPRPRRRLDPTAELVLTVLSQNTPSLGGPTVTPGPEDA